MEKTYQRLLLLLVSFLVTVSLGGTEGLDTVIPMTCSRPLPPKNAVISHQEAPRECLGNTPCGHEHGVDRYQEHDKVYFRCNEGFEKVSQLPYQMMSVTCGRTGKWFPDTNILGKCVSFLSLKNCDSANWFRCKTSGDCISRDKRCDCDNDCSDGSDETDCPHRRKLIMAPLKGKESTGIISSPGYPRTKDYPTQFNCLYHIVTLPGHHIQVDFEEFDLPKKENKKCVDSVRLLAVHPEFLRKKRKNLRKKLAGTVLRTSQTKCGSNGFQRIFSNNTHISINITLGYSSSKPSKPYRGLSLSWQVKNKRDFYQALHNVIEKHKNELVIAAPNKQEDTSDDDDTMYTVVLPIALTGMLPLSFIVFCLCRRITKQLFIDKSEPNCPSSRSKSNNKASATTFTLTENNLAKFDVQMGTVPHTGSRLLPPPEGNSNVTIESRFQTPLRVNTANKQYNTNCNSSQNSDLPRYIMSYDIPMTHSPTRQSSHSSHHLSSQSRGRSNSPRSNNTCSRNSSPLFNGVAQPQCANKSQQQRSKNSSRQYSREHITNSRENTHKPHDKVMQSTCSSQSTNTCSLCHQRRRACNAERLSFHHQQSALHEPEHYNLQQQIPIGSTQEEFDEIDAYVQQQPSRHHYLQSTYPPNNVSDEESDTSDFKEVYGSDTYPYNDSYHAPISYSDLQKTLMVPCNNPNSALQMYSKVPNTINYSDSELLDTTRMQSMHRIEKSRKVIYLEEICDTERRYMAGSDELYGSYNINTDRARGGSLICTH